MKLYCEMFWLKHMIIFSWNFSFIDKTTDEQKTKEGSTVGSRPFRMELHN